MDHTLKITYGTLRGAAMAVAEQLAVGRLQRPYECNEHGGFHLTSKGLFGKEITLAQVQALLDTFGIVAMLPAEEDEAC